MASDAGLIFLLTLLHMHKIILLFRYSSLGTVTLAGRVNTKGICPFSVLTPAETHDQMQLRSDC